MSIKTILCANDVIMQGHSILLSIYNLESPLTEGIVVSGVSSSSSSQSDSTCKSSSQSDLYCNVSYELLDESS